VNANVTKYLPQKCQICRYQMISFKLQMHQNIFGRCSAPDPAGGAYDAPRNPLVG